MKLRKLQTKDILKHWSIGPWQVLPSLMFVGKAEAYPRVKHLKATSLG
jgi:hypothetical protein